MHVVIAAEQVMADRNHVMKYARRREEYDHEKQRKDNWSVVLRE